MSAIFGIYYFDQNTSIIADLEAMQAALQHHGPDGTGLWHTDRIGLGHHMLHVSPESVHEQLPYQQGDLVITSQTRLDNRLQLCALLDLSADTPDSSILLAAYHKWGKDCVNQLLGPFTFAIWDDANRELFVARDHLGVNSLYYYHGTDFFAFSSEIKGLLAISAVPCVVNEKRIADYFTLHFYSDETFYEKIYRVWPAHWLHIRGREVKSHQYWQLTPGDELQLPSDEDYIAAHREKFDTAVARTVRTTAGIAAQISGGIDSSSVALVASQQLQRDILAFSMVAPGIPETDEEFYIDEVLAAGNFTSIKFAGHENDPLLGIDDWVVQLDEPVNVFPNNYIFMPVAKLAQQQGRRVMLTGIDGDATLSHSWDYFDELAYAQQWDVFAREAYLAQANGAMYRIYKSYGERAIRRLRDEGRILPIWRTINEVHRHGDVSRCQLLRATVLGPIVYGALGRPIFETPFSIELNPDFMRRYRLDEVVYQREIAARKLEPNARQGDVNMWYNGHLSFIMDVMNITNTVHQVEARHPFFDRELLEFSLSLPMHVKRHNGWGRYLHRRAMAGMLPEPIRWRNNKANLSWATLRGLLDHNPTIIEQMRDELADYVAGYIDMSRLLSKFTKTSNQTTRDAFLSFWMAFVLAKWLQHLETSMSK